VSTQETRATILVVDDNPVNLQLLFETLGKAGYRILVCEDGESAVAQAAAALPDLILMDVLLPGMSGYEACRAIHAASVTSETPVIFLTALTRTADKLDGFRAGGVDYLTKPLELEEVLARVSTHLQLRDLRLQLEQKNAELQQRDERRERLFAVLAHDLKSPMATLASAASLLAQIQPNNPEYPDIVETLAARANRLDRQITDLLAWGEYQVSHGELSPAQIDLVAVINALLKDIETEVEAKRISIRRELPDELRFFQDPTAIRTVLSNILGNAVKFTPQGKGITLSAVAADGGVTITIADTGIGMSEEQMQRLFRKADRFHRAGTDGERGAGLGLVLSYEIIELLHGSVTISSQEGQGTTFTLVIPHA
jgi:signal transduction histidine kinase